MIQNYTYQIGGSLSPEEPSYVSRQADRELYKRLKDGECCYIFNSRQMGKSSLRVRVMDRLQQEGIDCAVIDPQIIGTQLREDQWYAGMIKSLVKGFNLEPEFDFRQWWRSLDNPPIPPVQRFTSFLEDILLRQKSQPLVIFVEEIDSLLSLKFSADDFFILIRALYDNRALNPEFKRLTFALVGVTIPVDLIRNQKRSSFNIGTGIGMEGFTLTEAAPLMRGLIGKVSDPQAMLKAVLYWSGGQPFLTQKLLAIVIREIDEGNEPDVDREEWLEKIVKLLVIDNWEAQDVPQHLGTLQERVLRVSEKERGLLLSLYQHILLEGSIVANNSYEHMQLRLTGLVVNRNGQFHVYNPIYARVFNDQWVIDQLSELRPPFYAESLRAWHRSEKGDSAFLLRGEALRNAAIWFRGKRLSLEDEVFLQVSNENEKSEQVEELEWTRARSQLLTVAMQKSNRRMSLTTALAILAMAGIITIFSGWVLFRMRQILLESGKGNLLLVASRLGDDIDLYQESMVLKEAISRAIDAREQPDLVVWVRASNGKVLSQSETFSMGSWQVNGFASELMAQVDSTSGLKSLSLQNRTLITLSMPLSINGQLVGNLYVVNDVTEDIISLNRITRTLLGSGIILLSVLSPVVWIANESVRRSTSHLLSQDRP